MNIVLPLDIGFGGSLGVSAVLLIIAILALPTVFWIVELVEAARRQFPEPTLKVVWLLVIFFTHIIGALVYYFVGKQQGTLPNAGAGRY